MMSSAVRFKTALRAYFLLRACALNMIPKQITLMSRLVWLLSSLIPELMIHMSRFFFT